MTYCKSFLMQLLIIFGLIMMIFSLLQLNISLAVFKVFTEEWRTLTKFEVKLIMSHSLLWRHIVLLTVGVYSSKHRVLYTIGISRTRRFQKSVGPSDRLSVCPSVRL